MRQSLSPLGILRNFHLCDVYGTAVIAVPCRTFLLLAQPPPYSLLSFCPVCEQVRVFVDGGWFRYLAKVLSILYPTVPVSGVVFFLGGVSSSPLDGCC